MKSDKDTNTNKKNSRRELANAIRALSMDAVQQANSGHPGMPMGMADIAEVLWNDHLKHNPKNPEWFDRDRFVLSNGHGSMLLYSLLYLSGYPLAIDQIKNFRQFNQITAGHPEREPEVGIETTTGPLGQGITNAVGMALAEKILAATYNKPDLEIVNHRTWVFTGDGCLMEGISHEACSLAGTWNLGKLICIYDDNGISIDGSVVGWFTDDTAGRFKAYGWQVIDDVDGHDSASIMKAINEAKDDTDRPSLICCKTKIGFGSPNKEGTESTHGAPLGEDEIKATKEALDWNSPPFEIPENVLKEWNGIEKGETAENAWHELYSAYKDAYPELAREFQRRMNGVLPSDWKEYTNNAINEVNADAKDLATRQSSLLALNKLASKLPEMVGGSADLTGSNLTKHNDSVVFDESNKNGNYLNFGVREFGMSAIGNGMILHGGIIPYSGTFLTFSDYARNALRMAALMEVQNIFVFTHDSIGLGEDGPTHQPIEHVSSLRIMPNMRVWRPCDSVETIISWRDAIERNEGPTSLVLTRQKLLHQQRSEKQIKNISKGGYILQDSESIPDIILIATGSEVGIAVEAAESMGMEGIAVRVVSMPCTDLFDKQNEKYRSEVLPKEVGCRLAIEAGVSDYWWRYVGTSGDVIGIDCFGLSAPANELFEHFGFSAKNIVERSKKLIKLNIN
ncbi:MAG: transketolase [Pseudomonadota bacterium]|nr:transketolase [Pseudomonadota bacterium]